MTEKEYEIWKEQNPEEWDGVYKIVLDEFYKYKKENSSKDDDVMYRQVARDPNNREFTFSRVEKALTNKDDCCDDLVRMHKQYLDYLEKKKGENNHE